MRNPPEPQEPPLRLPPSPAPKPARVISYARVVRYWALMAIALVVVFIATLPLLPFWIAAGCPSDPDMRQKWGNLKQAAWDLA